LKVKRFISVFLLAFVFLSIVFLVYKEFARKDNKTANSVVEICCLVLRGLNPHGNKG
jgi:hypothetical protein